jgi:hypothetical protein
MRAGREGEMDRGPISIAALPASTLPIYCIRMVSYTFS